MTPYAQAKKEYLESDEYQRSVEAMLANGMKQPYVNNILISAFAAGWNAQS